MNDVVGIVNVATIIERHSECDRRIWTQKIYLHDLLAYQLALVRTYMRLKAALMPHMVTTALGRGTNVIVPKIPM